jgi:hypothetical protein
MGNADAGRGVAGDVTFLDARHEYAVADVLVRRLSHGPLHGIGLLPGTPADRLNVDLLDRSATTGQLKYPAGSGYRTR